MQLRCKISGRAFHICIKMFSVVSLQLFEAVSKKLAESGVVYSAEQCRTRLNNLRTNYNKRCAGQALSGSAREVIDSAEDLLVLIFNTRPLARSSQLTVDASFAGGYCIYSTHKLYLINIRIGWFSEDVGVGWWVGVRPTI